jgi:hypothetical protein
MFFDFTASPPWFGWRKLPAAPEQGKTSQNKLKQEMKFCSEGWAAEKFR